MKKLSRTQMARSIFFMLAVFMTFSLIFTTTGCKQEQVAPNVSSTPTTQKSETKYQIDGQEITEEGFFKQLLPNNQVSARDVTTDMTVIANAYRVLGEIGKKGGNIVNVFTSDDAYYAYADANGHPNERTYDYVTNDLANYAVTSGAIRAYETTGIVPQSYIDYMDGLLAKFGLQPSTAPVVEARTIFSQVFKNCNGDNSGGSFPIRTMPALGLIGFNDNISSFSPVGFIGGKVGLYDNTFFRKRMAEFWFWANNTFDLCGNSPLSFANDRASSWGQF